MAQASHGAKLPVEQTHSSVAYTIIMTTTIPCLNLEDKYVFHHPEWAQEEVVSGITMRALANAGWSGYWSNIPARYCNFMVPFQAYEQGCRAFLGDRKVDDTLLYALAWMDLRWLRQERRKHGRNLADNFLFVMGTLLTCTGLAHRVATKLIMALPNDILEEFVQKHRMYDATMPIRRREAIWMIWDEHARRLPVLEFETAQPVLMKCLAHIPGLVHIVKEYMFDDDPWDHTRS